MNLQSAASSPAAEVAWHDAECGGYAADFPAWERLARECGSPVLDLGAGTGRVALHLAARGFDMVAVDADPGLLAALQDRATALTLPVEIIAADVRELDLGRRFPLVIAPMQLVHLLEGAGGRARAWAALAAHLELGGKLGLAILREPLPPSGTPDPLPDVRECEGWVHSSLPLAVRVSDERVELDRLRQTVSPAGSLTEERTTTRLDRLQLSMLDRELAEAGLRVVASEPIPETDDHVGSLLVVAEAGDDDA